MVQQFTQGIIYLTGDKEIEAYRNYMHEVHNFDPWDRWGHNLTGFKMSSFFQKYPAEIVLKEKDGKQYYYPQFIKK